VQDRVQVGEIVRANRQRLIICLWLLVAISYFCFRSSERLLVWSDSPELTANLYGSFGFGPHHTLDEPGGIKQILIAAFDRVTTVGYRPLNLVIHRVGLAYFSTPGFSPYFWFAGVGMIVGLMSVCMFLVARRYTESNLAAILAVFLLLCSPPFVSNGWLIFSGIHALVLLLICLGLCLYWKVVETSHHRAWYVFALCVILLLGPWYREFVGGLNLLIVFLEGQRTRRPTLMMGLAGLFFLHALFPTALVKLLAFPNLPLQPVFALGQLGVQVELGSSSAGGLAIGQFISSMRWRALLTFLVLLPPTMIALGLIGYLLPSGWRRDQSDPSGSICDRSGGCIFLSIWALIFLLPFLKVYTLHGHLAYPLVPFSILVAIGVERLWQMTWRQDHSRRILRYAVGLILTIAVGDHILNVYGSYRTVHGINEGDLAVADWFKTHVPKGSIVICNALHVEDIRLFSDGHIVPYWTVDTGIVELKRAVETPAKLGELLVRNQNSHNVYFLDVNYKFTPEKVYYHSHKYVRNENVAMRKIGLIHTTRVRYPYMDPLRAFTPRSYILFLGGGDLENDFYHGPAQDGTPFMRELYAEYYVYQVTGTEVAPWDPNIPWRLVEESYKGFNILRYGDQYIAVGQALGPVDLRRLTPRMVNDFQARGGIAIGNSLDEVKQLVSQFPLAQRSDNASGPILVEEGYKGFNLLRYGEKIYAISQGEGAFEIDRIKKNDYSGWFSGDSLDEIKRHLDQVSVEQLKQTIPVPVLIEAGYRGFNLVRYGQKIYAIPQGEGAFEIERIGNNGYSRWFGGSSSGEVRRLIDQPLKK